MSTTVVNLKNDSYEVYIGRKKDTNEHYGNPFTHLPNVPHAIKVKTREESVACFASWLSGMGHRNVEQDRRQWILDHLEELRDKVLGCFCAPLSCHGHIYVRMLEKTK